jgi:hypothetical protein
MIEMAAETTVIEMSAKVAQTPPASEAVETSTTEATEVSAPDAAKVSTTTETAKVSTLRRNRARTPCWQSAQSPSRQQVLR